MGDVRLRELSRRWASSGTLEDEIAYLLERVRTRDVSEDQLRLACYCEHEAARIVEQVYDLRQEEPDVGLAEGVIAAAERAQEHSDPLVRRSARRAAQRAERALARARRPNPPTSEEWFAGLQRWGLDAIERAAIGVVRAAWFERARIDASRREEGDEALVRQLELADRFLVDPAETAARLPYLPAPEEDRSGNLVRLGNLLMRLLCARSAAAARRDLETSETRALEWTTRDLCRQIVPCVRGIYGWSEAGHEVAVQGARDELLHWALGYPRRLEREAVEPRPPERTHVFVVQTEQEHATPILRRQPPYAIPGRVVALGIGIAVSGLYLGLTGPGVHVMIFVLVFAIALGLLWSFGL